MPATIEELNQFTRFAEQKLNGELNGLSLEDCLRAWREAQEEDETIAAIQEGLDDVAAGRFKTIAEVDAEIRQQHGWPLTKR
jgi:hypothetical protein